MVGDSLQVTGDRWHVTCDRWQVKGDWWQVIRYKFLKNTICQKKIFFVARQFQTLHEQKFYYLIPFLSITFPQGFWKSKKMNIGLREMGVKISLNWVNKSWKSVKTLFVAAILHNCWEKIQIRDHFFPLLFPKDSKYLKNFDIGYWGVGSKRPLNEVNKVWRTDKHTKQKQTRNGKILCKKTKSALLENSKAYPSWQK